MEHLPYPRTFLRNVRRALRVGGVFAGSVPNYARHRYRYGDDLGHASVPPVHLSFWTPEALSYVLRAAGFRHVHVVVPRLCTDLLRPFGALGWRKGWRFLQVALGRDVATEMAFLARNV